MTTAGVIDGWRHTRSRLFQRRDAMALPGRLALAFGMACLTGLAAQVRIPLGFTPVPITGQVFAVLLAGILAGSGWGAVSQVIYVGLGAAGVPWFSGWTAGLQVTTAGYLTGFIPAAWLIGWLTQQHINMRGLPGQTLLMLAGVGVIYFCGALYFAAVLGTGLWATLVGAVLPFIPLDIAKALAAAAIASTLLPKENGKNRNEG